MAGPIFVVLFLLVVLPPVFLISKLRLTSTQKIYYRDLTILFPIVILILARAVNLSSGKNINDMSSLEKLIAYFEVFIFVFGSWIVLLIASLRQKKTPCSEPDEDN